MSLDVTLYVEVDTGGDELEIVDLFEANITHNLSKMAEEAGIYKHLWRPDEIGCKTASKIIDPVAKGLKKMKDDPGYFKKFDSPNGWGTYKNFVPWVEEYLEACIKHPRAKIAICR